MFSQTHSWEDTPIWSLSFLLQSQLLLYPFPIVFLRVLKSSFPSCLKNLLYVCSPILGYFSSSFLSLKPCKPFVQLFLEALLLRASPGNSVAILWLLEASAVPCCGIYHTLKKLSISGTQSLCKKDGSGLSFLHLQGSAA